MNGIFKVARDRWLRRSVLFLYLLTAPAVAIPVYRVILHADLRGHDIYWYWLEGNRLYRGENPYARILRSNMLDNREMYPTCLPLFYVACAAGHVLGIRKFDEFIPPWTVVCIAAHLAIGYALLAIVSRRGGLAAGLLGAGFWLINRFSLNVLGARSLDGLPILLLLVSIALHPRRPGTSRLLFGLSLSIKHIAVFLTPLYVLWAAKSAEGKKPAGGRGRRILTSCGQILLFPVLISVPFAIWNPHAFAKSLLFPGTRFPASEVGAVSLDVYLGLVGLPAKAPMLLIMVLIYIAAARGSLQRYGATLLCLAGFADLNSVVFPHYFAWSAPFLPLAATEWKAFQRADQDKRPEEASSDSTSRLT